MNENVKPEHQVVSKYDISRFGQPCVQRSIWTSELPPKDLILAKKLSYNIEIERRLTFFPI